MIGAGYVSIASMSAGNSPRWRGLAMALKAYYDGSGKWSRKQRGGKPDHYLTLAGYVATAEAWAAFEVRWAEMLARWPGLHDIHMSDANSLKNQFDRKHGWDETRVRKLLEDVFNHCLSPTGWGDFKRQFVGGTCTVNLDDYRRFVDEYSALGVVEPELMCAEHVVPIAYRLLPEDSTHPLGRDGSIELYFDQNEGFQKTITRVWESRKWKRSDGPIQFVMSVVATIGARVAGIQAADILAWHTHRAFTHPAEAQERNWFRALAAPLEGDLYMNYDEMVSRYGHFGLSELEPYHVSDSRKLPSAPRSPEPEPPEEPS